MRFTLAAALLALALPASASAAPTVTSDGTKVLVKDDSAATTVGTTVDLGPGEIRVTSYPEGAAELDAGTGCTQLEPAVVTCPLAGIQAIRLEMGGGDDRVWPGDGTLRREILGEAGADELGDSGGADLLDGGAGNDTLNMGGGDDEVHGGADTDVASWSDRSDPVEAVLPDTGTSSGNGSDGEDDVLHPDVEGLRGGQAGDRLVGNASANDLDGWLENDILEGKGGADTLVDDRGADTFDGGAGADFLDTSDQWPDTAIDCGGDADRLDADSLGHTSQNPFDADPVASGCETIAPEFIDGPDKLVAHDEFRVGHVIGTEDFSVTGGPNSPPEIEVHWHRCDGYEIPRECDLFKDDLLYELQPADEGRVMYAIVTVRNAAGEDHWPTEDSPVILPGRPRPEGETPPEQLRPPDVLVLPPGPPFPGPPPGYGDYGDYGDYADYLDPLSTLEDAIAARLKSLGRRFAGADPRTLAKARVIGHPFTFPALGTATVTWSAKVPGGGARAAATRRIVLARGSLRAAKGRRRSVPVRPTRAGRAALRRARRLNVTMTVRFVGGAATRAVPAVAGTKFTLRRR